MPCSLPSHCRTHRSRGSDRRQTLAPGRGHPLLSHSLVTCGCNSSEFKSVFQHWVFSAVSACSHPPCSVLGGLGLTAARGSTSDLPSAQVKPGRVGSSVSVSRPPPFVRRWSKRRHALDGCVTPLSPIYRPAAHLSTYLSACLPVTYLLLIHHLCIFHLYLPFLFSCLSFVSIVFTFGKFLSKIINTILES